MMPKTASLSAPRSLRRSWPALLLLPLLGAAWLWQQKPPVSPPPPSTAQVQTAPIKTAPIKTAPIKTARPVSWQVVNSYPHDPQAFLQGLVWHDGGFYESTGLEGRSTLRRVEFPSGKVLQKHALPPEEFGEGLDLWKDKLIQLTWQSRKGYVYDRKSFQKLREWSYQTEGWGLTNDGKNLILSDGSDTLFFFDPEALRPVQQLPVTLNGRPLRNLNELEFINGEVWANVWQTNIIVRIDPRSGVVNSYLDLSGVLPAKLRTGREDVLNGIAYDKEKKRIFIGGKLWPRLFEIKVQDVS
jgi:glutamine cyclotransferase